MFHSPFPIKAPSVRVSQCTLCSCPLPSLSVSPLFPSRFFSLCSSLSSCSVMAGAAHPFSSLSMMAHGTLSLFLVRCAPILLSIFHLTVQLRPFASILASILVQATRPTRRPPVHGSSPSRHLPAHASCLTSMRYHLMHCPGSLGGILAHWRHLVLTYCVYNQPHHLLDPRHAPPPDAAPIRAQRVLILHVSQPCILYPGTTSSVQMTPPSILQPILQGSCMIARCLCCPDLSWLVKQFHSNGHGKSAWLGQNLQ
jgi:hypothetical protein